MTEKYSNRLESMLIEMVEAASPFTSSDIVDETCGTIPLTERLEAAILAAKNILNEINQKPELKKG